MRDSRSMDKSQVTNKPNTLIDSEDRILESVPYMQRLRDYYLALGYGNPYQWASYSEVPFATLTKPLSESKIGLITTAAPYKEGAGNQGPKAPYNAAAKFYKVYSGNTNQVDFLGISHVGYDRKYSTAEDINSFFPLEALKRAERQGRVGQLSARYYGAPTNRSQATTIKQDCSDLLDLLRQDDVDVVVLVPN